MKKLIIIVIVLGAAGWLGYRYVLATPEARACERLGALCGDDSSEVSSCEEDLGELRRTVGPELVERAVACMNESDTCVEGVACMATGVIRGAAREAIEGIQRGLEE